jgi:hypothetical protein
MQEIGAMSTNNQHARHKCRSMRAEALNYAKYNRGR